MLRLVLIVHRLSMVIFFVLVLVHLLNLVTLLMLVFDRILTVDLVLQFRIFRPWTPWQRDILWCHIGPLAWTQRQRHTFRLSPRPLNCRRGNSQIWLGSLPSRRRRTGPCREPVLSLDGLE